MPEERKDCLKHQFTAVNVPISVNEDGEKKRRTFDAEVYSGGRIDNHYYWGRSGVVIDLQGLQLKSKIGLVEEHFGGKRVGVATSYEVNTKFSAKGHFLSNPKAKEIVQDIDEEYPFQMSWWADPESIEEIAPGKTIEVNGQTFTFLSCLSGSELNTCLQTAVINFLSCLSGSELLIRSRLCPLVFLSCLSGSEP